jgi:DNA-binding FadR family transcriptional regulator
MENIKHAILDGTIKPGDLLPSEAEMSEQMDVGKSSVREAIKMLSAMGVVESIQGEGTYVRSNVDDQGINPMVYQLVLMQGSNEQIFQLREMLEPPTPNWRWSRRPLRTSKRS